MPLRARLGRIDGRPAEKKYGGPSTAAVAVAVIFDLLVNWFRWFSVNTIREVQELKTVLENSFFSVSVRANISNKWCVRQKVKWGPTDYKARTNTCLIIISADADLRIVPSAGRCLMFGSVPCWPFVFAFSRRFVVLFVMFWGRRCFVSITIPFGPAITIDKWKFCQIHDRKFERITRLLF